MFMGQVLATINNVEQKCNIMLSLLCIQAHGGDKTSSDGLDWEHASNYAFFG